ncbi:hypothetical protein PIGHUM_04436 [Pigmentiphaga humi]|jgi:hypothetical protein|uniref:Uncharacterized protein n=1 Tax=Pigmentiphaga humi TaxID=2478468 RepID=A0A3P4B7Q5_9BURK|nr:MULTISPECIES: hypothetical protein [Pseudomonadota]NQB37148.1 hypothetical protein [Pseudomonas aeruginosa]VCU72337.1 hypothetical protein PIGHUM_04436 [Pigmentiphaga humi]HEJ4320006.1 hypothetical protein [Pseudomonas aeruginosa]
MGDMGDYWRDVRPAMKEESQRRRSSNRESSSRLLTEAGISFESKNEGSHLIVSGQGAVVDFWPGTGLWIVRGSKERRRGVRQLITRLGGRWPVQAEERANE